MFALLAARVWAKVKDLALMDTAHAAWVKVTAHVVVDVTVADTMARCHPHQHFRER